MTTGMRRTLTTLFAALTLATGAAACGDDSGSDDGSVGNSDAPVNTDTPADNNTATPAPNNGGQGEGE